MTKRFEEVRRGTAAEALAHFQEPRGEFTIVIEGSTARGPAVTDDDVRRQLEGAKDRGVPTKDAVKAVASATGRPRNDVYALWVELDRDSAVGPTTND
jgi:16S rRNA (cytidine1402-2'-O)-methyltransferase